VLVVPADQESISATKLAQPLAAVPL
jgi:hypothetical protein